MVGNTLTLNEKKSIAFRLTTFKKNNVNCNFRHSLLMIIISMSLSGYVFSAESFNPEMLKNLDDGGSVDNVNLDYFAQKGGQSPGTYKVDIYLNDRLVDTREVEFVSVPGVKDKIYGILTPSDLADYGVKLDVFPSLAKLDLTSKLNNSIDQFIPDATERLDIGKLRYNITVPQIGVNTYSKNSVDPKRWNNGINALMMNYSYNGSTSDYSNQGKTQSNFINLRSGANLGPWRLRNYSTYTSSHTDSSNNSTATDISSYQSINTYLQRDVKFLQGGQLTLGQYTTPSDVFDSFQFTGMQLASDDKMLPDSMSQFAPTIRGIAKSNAQITIRQNGYIIYQTNVSPGPFAITDLYPSSSGGDMEIAIKEADGTITKYTQASSSVPILQRENRFKYNLVLGQYRSGNDDVKSPHFMQVSSIYGLNSFVTVYGGMQYADNYSAVSAGFGLDMGSAGAISLDGTQAKSEFENDSTEVGQSYRAMYAKNFDKTGTNLQLAGYRYSTEGYYSLSDVQNYQTDTGNDFENYDRTHNQRSKIQVSVNQSLGDFGAIYISGSQQEYWNGGGKEKTQMLGYNTNFRGVSYGLNYSYTKNPGITTADKVFSFNLSIPFSKLLPGSNAWATYNMTTSEHGSTSQQAGISGTLLHDQNLSYSVQQGYENLGAGNSGNASMTYKGGAGVANLGYSYDKESQQWNYGLQGGVVIHRNGITLSQPLSDTIALVKAPKASDVSVMNNSGVHTDWRGYAVVPYVQPYRKNEISLDTNTFASNVDIDMTSQTVIPTQGAIVLADYKTRIGQKAIIQLKFMGKNVPFGAAVSLLDEDSTTTGIVSDDGQVFLSGLPDSGVITVKWGNESNQQCTANYSLPVKNDNKSDAIDIQETTATCR